MPEFVKIEEIARRETARYTRTDGKDKKKLSKAEIQDRLQDLDDVLNIYAKAREKLSESSVLIREAINLYQNATKKCIRSNSNRHAMVVQRLKIKFILDTAVTAAGKLMSVINSSARIQIMTSDDLKQTVVDPELLDD
jgi:hypothetical protein